MIHNTFLKQFKNRKVIFVEKTNKINIALFYGKPETKDALYTLEDLKNELEAWKLPVEELRGDKIECNDVQFQFVDVEKSKRIFKKGDFFKKIYISNRLKNEYNFQCSTISEKVVYHPYPFQSLIDLVIDARDHKK